MSGNFQVVHFHLIFILNDVVSRMIVVIAVSLVMPSAYHIALIYISAAVMFFLVSFLWSAYLVQ